MKGHDVSVDQLRAVFGALGVTKENIAVYAADLLNALDIDRDHMTREQMNTLLEALGIDTSHMTDEEVEALLRDLGIMLPKAPLESAESEMGCKTLSGNLLIEDS